MSYIEFDSSTITFGNAKAIVMIGEYTIGTFSIPSPRFGEKYRDSINSTTEYFEYKNVNYDINISSSNVGTYITIETENENDDINNFEIYIDFQDTEEEFYDEEFYEEDNKKIDMNIYVPTLPFTNTTSSVLFELTTSEKVLPLIDIETVDKFNGYLSDEMINFKHFLDIYSMKDMINRDKRKEIIDLRKKEKKELGESQTEIPKAIHKFINDESKTKYLKDIKDKTNIIPIFKWDENADLNNLNSFIRRLNGNYAEIGIRVSSLRTFFSEISEIAKIDDSYLILDLNTNFDVEKIKKLIKESQKYSFKNIIYLGAQFNADEISIPRDDTNKNIISSNKPLQVYESIFNDIEITTPIGYGDYCGFDRKTITEMPVGGRGTARIVLGSIDSSKKLLIRRGWDDNDITVDEKTKKKKLGYGHSMKRLLCDIQQGEVDKESNYLFMDENVCDADFSLKDYCPDITTPGMVKTLCLRHNVFTIIHNFIN